MTGSLTLGILAAFVGFVAIVGVSVWSDRRRRVPALPATDALAAVKAGEDENGRAARSAPQSRRLTAFRSTPSTTS
ncbi:hypothetical protein [uncultured Variovorax sp.]|uniref:hypothetical protein n=1 Tax=uncultured Variovorax sp. TaxID=114708 RepID=UPI00262A84A3|nr:hypothetical protein [uncultured Variovorax sp.]